MKAAASAATTDCLRVSGNTKATVATTPTTRIAHRNQGRKEALRDNNIHAVAVVSPMASAPAHRTHSRSRAPQICTAPIPTSAATAGASATV